MFLVSGEWIPALDSIELKELVMKKFLAIGLLLIGVSVVSGQTGDSHGQDEPRCALTLAQAPDLRGLKLGMTVEQMLALFPGSREDNEIRTVLSRPANPFGVTNLIIRPEKYSSKSKFAGIRQINIAFLDGRLSNLYAGYNGPEWKHVDEFVTKFAEGTRLPAADAWEAYVGMDTQLKTLKCKEFEISIFAGGQGGDVNYVKLQDTPAQQKLKERRAKAREAKAAKP
jgi:hypothetical protein